ncbi:hypothetical protein [Paraburkholderia adhaesiva]|nr:hypothetical protein [Paraburkholderia adhaesiva]
MSFLEKVAEPVVVVACFNYGGTPAALARVAHLTETDHSHN